MATESSQKQLDLRVSADASERGETFWNVSQVEMKFSVERDWIRAVRGARRKPDYGMLNMDGQLEEVVGNKLELVGPMLDSYLKEIGKSMKNKLSRSKATGLVSPVSLFVPWSVFKHIVVLVGGYSGDVSTSKNHVHTLTLSKMDSVRKLFSPARFTGETFFAQRHFKKVPSKAGGKPKSVYNGKSQIVVTEGTPLTMSYSTKTERVTVTFYVQRYTDKDFAVDTSLQALMNA